MQIGRGVPEISIVLHHVWGVWGLWGLAGWLGGWLLAGCRIYDYILSDQIAHVQDFLCLAISDKMYYSSTDISRSCLLDYVGSPTCPLL